LILVHGDTTTAFASALAAYYLKIPSGHIEAGLRTFDKFNPFPEEMNRRLIDSLCDYHFCPTKNNRANLISENLGKNSYITGNTVIDAVKYVSKKSIHFVDPRLKTVDFSSPTILLTCHRRESFGQPMVDIFTAIKKVLDHYPGLKLIYPVHLNPTVQLTANQILSNHPQAILIPPVAYTDMVKLMRKCFFTITDSGGLQEEVPAFHRPVLVLRNETERQEGISAGTLKLIGTNPKVIFRETSRLLTDKTEYQKYQHAKNPYGSGHSSQKIINIIKKLPLCG
jgi:UDP-N-acetylglucosamine 2-epimerase